MRLHFESMNEYRDPLYATGTAFGSGEAYGDRFIAATRAVDLLCDDLSLDSDVLDFGEVIGAGTPDEILKIPKVIEAYIGEE